MTTPLLEIDDLNVSFNVGDGTLEAVRGVSLTVANHGLLRLQIDDAAETGNQMRASDLHSIK